MSIITTLSKMTAAQFLALDDDAPGVRRELDDGEIVVSPSLIPRHGFAVLRLARILGAHIDDQELGELHHDTDTFLDKLNCVGPICCIFPAIAYFSSVKRTFRGRRTWRQKC